MPVKRSIFVFLLVLCSLVTSGISYADAPGAKTSQQAPSVGGSHLWIRNQMTSPEVTTQQDQVVSEIQRPSHQANVGLTAQVELLSIADACIMQGHSTLNLSTYNDMWAGYDDDPESDGQVVRSLVRFDLSQLPPGAVVVSSELSLSLIASRDFPDRSRRITIHRAPAPWSEAEVTWSNAPAPAEAYGYQDIMTSAWGRYQFDVTNLVRAWVNNTYANQGLMVIGPEESGYDSAYRSFGTREAHTEGDYGPLLRITYSTASPTNTPTTRPTGSRFTRFPLIIRQPTPTPTRTATPTRTQTPPPTTPSASSWAEQVVTLVNAERASEGLAPLQQVSELMQSAALHSQDMASHNFMGHTGSDGSSPGDRMVRAGYNWYTYGENVGAGYGSPASVVAGWMASSGHRANILNSGFRDVGAGYAYDSGSTYGHYWTLNLGAR